MVRNKFEARADAQAVPKEGNHGPGKRISKESKTQQSQAATVDLNKIVARHGEDVWKRFEPNGVYGNAIGARDLQGAIEMDEESMQLFETLPAHVRRAAGNDRVTLLNMLADPEEAQRLMAMGMPEETIEADVLEAVRLLRPIEETSSVTSSFMATDPPSSEPGPEGPERSETSRESGEPIAPTS